MRDLLIPRELRSFFKKPFGELYRGEGVEVARKIKDRLKGEKLIIVGDVTLKNMLAVGVKPDLAIVDLKTRRGIEEVQELSGRVVKAKNPAGMISKELWECIHEAVEKPGTLILVEGEEDLAVLPCIIEADWDTVILYGQPDEGIVLVRVDEEKKLEAGLILKVLLREAAL
jgi:hypothetical protein